MITLKMEDILRIINSDPELKAKFETAVDNYCNSREGQLVLAWETKKHNLTGDQMEALTFALEWADAHPNWISVEDELPPKKSEYDGLSNNVFATDGKEIYESVYNHDFEEWFTHDLWAINNITHWMPRPQAPLVTDLNKKDLPPVSWQEGNILVEEEGGEE